MNHIKSKACLFLATLMLAAGCIAPKQIPDPLLSWLPSASQDPKKLDRGIRDDYQDYINRLPPAKRSFIGVISFYEDGTGQHAVKIERGVNGTYWEYVLIYDRQSMRVKVVTYIGGGYRS